MQGRNTDTFDHVKRDLHVEEEEDDSVKGAALRAMSEDQKRTMARLNTTAATEVRCQLSIPPVTVAEAIAMGRKCARFVDIWSSADGACAENRPHAWRWGTAQ